MLPPAPRSGGEFRLAGERVAPLDRCTESATVKLTRREYEALQALAAPLTVSAWLRELVRARLAQRATDHEVLLTELLAFRAAVLTILASVHSDQDVAAMVSRVNLDTVRAHTRALLTTGSR
jgi:hypothetical protein